MALSEQQKVKMKKNRDNILEAATTLFAMEGYEGTTIKKVSEAAGISFGSVFTYFKDKEELFSSVVLEPLHDLSEQVFAFDEDAEDPILELEKMVTHHIKLFASMNKYLALVVQVVGQFQKYPDIFTKFDQFHDEFRKKVGYLIENGQQKGVLIQQDPLNVSTLYISLLIGIRLNTTDKRFSVVWESYIPTTMNLFGPILK